MATTVSASFSTFKSNLEITSLQQATVSTRQTNVRDAVSRRLTVVDSFITGSYKRHTMISPLKEADVDVFVVMDPTYYSATGYTSLLERVRSSILETYTTTPKISRNGQAVTITFTDFVVDVVPGFNRKGGGYLIPSTSEKKWIETNPKVHESFITNANTVHKGDLVPLIKMIKDWNRKCGRPIKSFYLELLTEKVLQNVTISSFPSACRYVFDKGREQIKWQIVDPSGLGGQVSALASGNLADAIGRFETAYQRAVAAETHERAGRTESAVAEWRKIFGNAFPSYG